jgi:hypothetical protein
MGAPLVASLATVEPSPLKLLPEGGTAIGRGVGSLEPGEPSQGRRALLADTRPSLGRLFSLAARPAVDGLRRPFKPTLIDQVG